MKISINRRRVKQAEHKASRIARIGIFTGILYLTFPFCGLMIWASDHLDALNYDWQQTASFPA